MRTWARALLAALFWMLPLADAVGQDGRRHSSLTGSQPPGQDIPVPPAPDLLSDDCVVSVLNRTTAVNRDGTWILPTVPANFGPVRVRASCVRGGVTLFGQSELFSLGSAQSLTVPHIILGNVSAVPQSIRITAPAARLTEPGQGTQLTVSAIYQGGTTVDITAASTGTLYRVSNPAIANVSASGLVAAVGSGSAIVQALNEGAQGIFAVSVVLTTDSDNDGIPDDAELRLGLNPRDRTDALLDPDQDGLTNLQEFQPGTNINSPDTDTDGLTDGQEVLRYGTNAILADTDGDLVPDGVEVQTGSEPLSAASVFLDKALASLEVSPASFALSVDAIEQQASQQLAVLGRLIDGRTTINLTSTQTGTSYLSSDLTICNFGAPDGNVFAGSGGSCTITIANSGHTATATAVVTGFTPVPLSFVAIPGYANNVAVNGNYAYVAAGSGGLRIVDVSNRNAPTVVASTALVGNANDVKVLGNTAYVAAGTAGLHIVDVTNPLAPQLVRTVTLPGVAWDVVVSAGIAYVAAGSSGLQLIDVSNPSNPISRGALALPGTVKGVAVDPVRRVAVVVGTAGLFTVGIANPGAPTLLASLNYGGDPRDVALRGDFAFVADFTRSLSAVDILNPSAPVYRSSTPTTLGGFLQDVATSGDFALGADVFFTNGVPIVDIGSAPGLFPRFILNFPTGDARGFRDDNATGIAVDGAYVYFTAAQGIAENGVTGDTRLYVGHYRSLNDIRGVPPVLSITAPAQGTTVIEGSVIPVQVTATDDVGVAAVSFLVDGAPAFTGTTEPYQFGVRVPAGVSRLTLGATAVDLGGNSAAATDVILNVIPDTGTTVTGRAVDAALNPLPGLTATAVGLSAITGSDGRFAIPGVPTASGNITVYVTGVSGGTLRSGVSGAVAPVTGGTTSVGDIVTAVGPVLVNFESIPGMTAQGNFSGQIVPLAARLGTQLQTSTGVRFNSTAAYVALVRLGVGHAASGINGIGGVNAVNALQYSAPTVVTFSVPGSPSTPAVTDFVSIRADRFPGSGSMTMQAFDPGGTLIGSVTDADTGGILSLSIPNIHSIRVTQTQSNIAFDDLRFNPVLPAPAAGFAVLANAPSGVSVEE